MKEPRELSIIHLFQGSHSQRRQLLQKKATAFLAISTKSWPAKATLDPIHFMHSYM